MLCAQKDVMRCTKIHVADKQKFKKKHVADTKTTREMDKYSTRELEYYPKAKSEVGAAGLVDRDQVGAGGQGDVSACCTCRRAERESSRWA